MAFCIECGTKVPDLAKFCPQCGTPVVQIGKKELKPAVSPPDETEAQSGPTETIEAMEPVEIKGAVDGPEVDISDNVDSQDIPSETQMETGSDIKVHEVPDDTAPDAENSLAATVESLGETPKSKAGLFAGLGLLALIAAGGGAYALGLFGGDRGIDKRQASKPNVTISTPLSETPAETSNDRDLTPVQAAYQDAIRTGRISDLGEFARTYPKNSLAKDAEAAAFASLNRQQSVLAFKTFTQQFPEADTSNYNGPRINSDVETSDEDTQPNENNETNIEINPPETNSAIRLSIASRAEALEPFLEQGDIEYVLVVVDEMLALSDLSQEEATFLLNLRAKAETSRGLAVGVKPEINTNVETPAAEYTPTLEPITIEGTLNTTPANPDPVEPVSAFDTAAKPIERFGAITPDEATEPGECNMEFSIDTSGTPINIIPTCTHPILIEPAIEAVSGWLYTPASLTGTPVQQDGLVVTLRFHIE